MSSVYKQKLTMRTQRGNKCVKKTLKIVDFAASLPFRLRRTAFHLEEIGVVLQTQRSRKSV